jgi:hypothetical protein
LLQVNYKTKGGGWMKVLLPMTLSGRVLAEAAILVIEIDDVFVAKIVSGLVILSKFKKSSRLSEGFSLTAYYLNF